ncbi:ABC transporter permease subunit [Halocatena marina]|uniref:ABC transporter permease subunit n=1 Tax=Halocatena marina TaxID=2934937 RepID=UPI00200D5CE5|nr:ABC transporter permease subunit [Halocatena marina]
MTTIDVLRHDLTVVRRTIAGKLLLALSLGAMFGGIIAGHVLSNGPLTADFLALSLWLIVGTVVPFGALLTTAVTIAADRDSGRLRLLFGTPLTKTDVYVGTLASRVVTVSASVVVGFVLVGLIVLLLPADVSPSSLFGLAAFTLLLCVAYTSVGIAVSAVSSTRLRAVGVALGFYVWAALWPHIVSTIAESEGPPYGELTTLERIAHFVGTLSPFGAYSQIVTPPRAIYAESVSGPLLAPPMMSLILIVWAVVPVSVGYWWFSRVDL